MKKIFLAFFCVCVIFFLGACASLGDPLKDSQTDTLETADGTLITDPALVIENYDQLITQFRQKIYTTEWIRRVFQITYFDNRAQQYEDPQVKEEWLLFDANGQVAESYNWLSTPSGEILQEAYFHDGVFTNVTSGVTTMGGTPEPRTPEELHDFTGGFANLLKNGKNQQQELVILNNAEVWRFTTQFQDGELQFVRALYIDRETKMLAGAETYLVETDGSLKLVSGVIYTVFEIGAEPPIGRFEEILQKATALPPSP